MPPHPKRACASPRSCEWAAALVRTLVSRWRQGLSLRLVRKRLRKRGIHPWSLLLHLEGEEFETVARALRLPAWARAGTSQANPYCGDLGFHFSGNFPPGAALPSGLVAPYLGIDGNARLRDLPRRAWIPWLSLGRLPALRRLPAWVSRLETIHLEACPSLEDLPGPMRNISNLEIEDCQGLQSIPRLGSRHRVEAWVRLVNLSRLREIRRGSRVMDLWMWGCPALEDLGLEGALDSLYLHGGHALKRLPEQAAPRWMDVTDCPLLPGSLGRLRAPEGRYEPWRRPGRERASRPGAAAVRAPEPPALLEEEEGPVWPWPPARRGVPEEARTLLRTLSVLHLEGVERLRLLARLPVDLTRVLQDELTRLPDPPSAVRQALAWLRGMGREDRVLALTVLAQLEGLSLGAGSAMNGLEDAQMKRLDLTVCRNWLGGSRPDAGLWPPGDPLAESLPGPLVLLDPDTVWSQAVDLRHVEGPLWAAGHLAIQDCPYLETLPDRLVVEGDLQIADCPSLGRLPARMEVWGNLDLRGLPGLDPQVCRVHLGGVARVAGTPGLELAVTPLPGSGLRKRDGWIDLP